MKFLISYYLFFKKICLKNNNDFNIDNNDKGEIQLIKNQLKINIKILNITYV